VALFFFFFILRDVHFMLSVICECLVEGQTKWEEGEGGERSEKVAVRSGYDTDWSDLNFVGGNG